MAERDVHRRHLYEGEPDEDLVAGLEPDQLVAAMEMPLARMRMTRSARVGLLALRVFVLAAGAMVLYVFILAVLHGNT